MKGEGAALGQPGNAAKPASAALGARAQVAGGYRVALLVGLLLRAGEFRQLVLQLLGAGQRYERQVDRAIGRAEVGALLLSLLAVRPPGPGANGRARYDGSGVGKVVLR